MPGRVRELQDRVRTIHDSLRRERHSSLGSRTSRSRSALTPSGSELLTERSQQNAAARFADVRQFGPRIRLAVRCSASDEDVVGVG